MALQIDAPVQCPRVPAPIPFGRDDQGREIVSFLVGRRPERPSHRIEHRTPLRPSIVVEVSDRMDSGRIRHAARFQRWRMDKDAAECLLPSVGGLLGASGGSA